MVTIEKCALDGMLPTQRLHVTGSHAILYKDTWVRAIDLQHLDGVSVKPANGEIVYNILLRRHSTMTVGGLTVETMNPAHMKIVSTNNVIVEDATSSSLMI